MRIQHNVMAMNAYRNLTGNQSALSKNLEKLSSGYRINRAGDDAAGLAISEKMRSQITGLEAAQKNVKDGVSLVKTAEGAMQEIHDMLGRMKYLATQSANGTYDNEVDRANIQKEVNSLKSEINRIADSANFNGQKLLDGSLSAEGGVGGSGHVDTSKMGVDITTNSQDVKAIKGKWTLKVGTQDLGSFTKSKDAALEFTVNYIDDKGQTQAKTVKIRHGSGSKDLVLDNGTPEGMKLKTKLASKSKIKKTEFDKILKEALDTDPDLKQAFDIQAAGTHDITFEARQGGTKGAQILGLEVKTWKTGSGTNHTADAKLEHTTEAKDATKAFDISKAKIWDNDRKAASTDKAAVNDLKDAIFEVNGKKFAFIHGNLTDDQKTELRNAGVEHWVSNVGSSVTGTEVSKLVDQIAKETGLKVTQGKASTNGSFTKGITATSTWLTFEPLKGGAAGNGGLKLQIGDTSDEFNQMSVAVGDMHTAALGIADVDLGSQNGAADAVKRINDAINSVSSVRGDLGAIQNRLEHTEKNLSVMQENIQQAESNIRDTDVAAEMMAYTKNNILIQSAQAMLAQANQVPQGVLQLLQ